MLTSPSAYLHLRWWPSRSHRRALITCGYRAIGDGTATGTSGWRAAGCTSGPAGTMSRHIGTRTDRAGASVRDVGSVNSSTGTGVPPTRLLLMQGVVSPRSTAEVLLALLKLEKSKW